MRGLRRARSYEPVQDRTADPTPRPAPASQVDDRSAEYRSALADHATDPRRDESHIDDRAAASAPSAVVLIAGIWLVISRFMFDYPAAGAGTDGRWNGAVIGVAVALIAMTRLSTTASNPMLSLVNLVLGGWMVAAPWLYGYDRWGAESAPAWSDLLTGVGIVIFALASWSAGSLRRTGATRRLAT